MWVSREGVGGGKKGGKEEAILHWVEEESQEQRIGMSGRKERV